MTSIIVRSTNTADAFTISLADALSVPDGGFSVRIEGRTAKHVTEGFAVAIHPDRERQIGDKVTADDIRQYVHDNRDFLLYGKHVFGGWRCPETGVAYLDVSVIVDDAEVAFRMAQMHGQAAYWDFANRKSVTV